MNDEDMHIDTEINICSSRQPNIRLFSFDQEAQGPTIPESIDRTSSIRDESLNGLKTEEVQNALIAPEINYTLEENKEKAHEIEKKITTKKRGRPFGSISQKTRQQMLEKQQSYEIELNTEFLNKI